LAFHTTTASLAKAGTDTTTHATRGVLGAFGWSEFIETQSHGLFLDTDHVIDFIDHAAIGRSIDHFNGMINTTQTQTLQTQLVIL
jgi:hypothetical protein